MDMTVDIHEIFSADLFVLPTWTPSKRPMDIHTTSNGYPYGYPVDVH